MSELSKKQRLFTKLLPKLLDYGHSKGYEFTLADGSIDPHRRVITKDKKIISGTDCVHLPSGQHYKRLAQDLNLWIGDEWISSYNPAWDDLGAFWKSLAPGITAWGGDFSGKDYNHFSITTDGVS